MPTQNQNGKPLNMAQTPGCGLCEICSKGVSNELSRPSPGDRGRRDPTMEKLNAMRIRYKEQGRNDKALTVAAVIRNLQR